MGTSCAFFPVRLETIFVVFDLGVGSTFDHGPKPCPRESGNPAVVGALLDRLGYPVGSTKDVRWRSLGEVCPLSVGFVLGELPGASVVSGGAVPNSPREAGEFLLILALVLSVILLLLLLQVLQVMAQLGAGGLPLFVWMCF